MQKLVLMRDLLRNARLAITNRLRLLGRRPLDYVVLSVSGSFPERTARPRRPFLLSLLPWPAPPVSVEAFDRALERLSVDPRVNGAVLIVSGLSAGPATISSLRQAIARFRESGKRAVAYVPELSFWAYLVACACDEILAPVSATFLAAGLRAERVFLKDTLALAGIEADFEAIAEYKVTPDTFRRARMTESHRRMLESLLDSFHGQTVGTIAQDRGLPRERVQELQDRVPLTAAEAHEAGLLDGVCYEDELADRLGEQRTQATLVGWDEVQQRLVRPLRWHTGKAIGLVSLEGTIMHGPSRRSPLPIPLPLPIRTQMAGSATLAAQLRTAATDRRLAAVVLHVDSPGGSALASDLICREVAGLRARKPVVVYMGNVAASGGYYVSAPANEIICQGMTLTGSIGIWAGKFVSQGLYDRIQASREVVSRGKAAGIWSDMAAFSDEERARVRDNLVANYERFKDRVVEGRGLTEDAVEAVARGRQWTGEQALDLGLVNGLGDLRASVERARELAGLDLRRTTPLVSVPAARRTTPPLPLPTGADSWLGAWAGLMREGVLALAPWHIRIRG